MFGGPLAAGYLWPPSVRRAALTTRRPARHRRRSASKRLGRRLLGRRRRGTGDSYDSHGNSSKSNAGGLPVQAACWLVLATRLVAASLMLAGAPVKPSPGAAPAPARSHIRQKGTERRVDADRQGDRRSIVLAATRGDQLIVVHRLSIARRRLSVHETRKVLSRKPFGRTRTLAAGAARPKPGLLRKSTMQRVAGQGQLLCASSGTAHAFSAAATERSGQSARSVSPRRSAGFAARSRLVIQAQCRRPSRARPSTIRCCRR